MACSSLFPGFVWLISVATIFPGIFIGIFIFRLNFFFLILIILKIHFVLHEKHFSLLEFEILRLCSSVFQENLTLIAWNYLLLSVTLCEGTWIMGSTQL